MTSLGAQIRLPFQRDLIQRRLRFRLIERRLIRRRIDREKQIALFYIGAVLKMARP